MHDSVDGNVKLQTQNSLEEIAIEVLSFAINISANEHIRNRSMKGCNFFTSVSTRELVGEFIAEILMRDT